MKIFNWIHRQCYSVQSFDVSLNEEGGSSEELAVRSGPLIRKAKADKEPLLEQDKQAIENWELDGILTIGTLAINPLEITIKQEDEEGCLDEAKKQYNEYDQHDGDQVLAQDQEWDTKMYKMYVDNLMRHILRANLSSFLKNDVMKCKNEIEAVDEEVVNESAKGERVTLRDLFLADKLDEKVARKAKAGDGYGEDNSDIRAMKKTKKRNLIKYNKLPAALVGKKGFSLKNKKLPPGVVDDEIGSLKKLHMFVTKMMKKKIHPDMEARLQKKVQGKLNDSVSARIDGHDSTKEEDAGNESVSLLPSQGIAI